MPPGRYATNLMAELFLIHERQRFCQQVLDPARVQIGSNVQYINGTFQAVPFSALITIPSPIEGKYLAKKVLV